MASSKLTIRGVQDAVVVGFCEISITKYEQIESVKRDLYALVDKDAAKKIVVDFTALDFLTTEAIGALLMLQAKAEAAGGRVALCGLRGHPLETFEFLRLHEAFEIHPTQGQALAALGVQSE